MATVTPIKNRAALYLRSSKDRSDVSIDSQRRELTKLATDRGFSITQEYSDAVESAKDDRRPAFQQLRAAKLPHLGPNAEVTGRRRPVRCSDGLGAFRCYTKVLACRLLMYYINSTAARSAATNRRAR